MVYIVTLNDVSARHFSSIHSEYLVDLFIEYAPPTEELRLGVRAPGSLLYRPLMWYLMLHGPGLGVKLYRSLLDGASGVKSSGSAKADGVGG